MKCKNIFAINAIVLTMVVMIFAMSFTVFAVSDNGEGIDVTEAVQTPLEEIVTPSENVVETEAVVDDNSDSGYDDGYDDDYDDSGDDYAEYVEKETEAETYYEVYENELPQVESQYVTEPTTMKIPDVEVSDTSLIGGVIAWLCVAVGIAVIAGVLVSQRTRQTSSNVGSMDSRRR